MRHDQRADEDMRHHTDNIVTGAGRNQPTDRDPTPADRAHQATERPDRATQPPATDRPTADRGERPTERDTTPGARDTTPTDRPDRGERPTEREITPGGRETKPTADRGERPTERDMTPGDRGTTPTERADRGERPTERAMTQGGRDTERAEDRPRPELPQQRGDGRAARPTADGEAGPARLFPAEDAERFRSRWQQIQTGFVDDPRAAVQGANDLLAEVIRALAGAVNDRKQELEGKWQEASGDQTEDLRLALRRYRSFTNRLLEV